MSVAAILAELSVTGAAYAAPVRGDGIGTNEGELVTPASVMSCLANALLDSSLAASRDGPKTGTDAPIRASATPAASGASGRTGP